jgi:hypothetical protein
MSKEIPLSNGKGYAIVDDDVYKWAKEHKWHNTHDYATRKLNKRRIYLHKEILELGPGQEADHINRNSLDNRRENLRIVSHSIGQQNRAQTNNKIQFKGVHVDYRNGNFRAQIKKDGKTRHLQSCSTPQEAARIYDEAALELFGPDALTNEKLGYI